MTPLKDIPESIRNRVSMERRIARKMLMAAEKAGFTFIIDNGGEPDEEITAATARAAYKEMFATDDERVYLVKDGKRHGMVYFVYGNDGHDVMADYSERIELIIQPAIELADKLAQ